MNDGMNDVTMRRARRLGNHRRVLSLEKKEDGGS